MAKTAEDYKNQLHKLMPPGRAYPRVSDSFQDKLFHGAGEELARVDARGDDLLQEALPDTTSELLEDWERVAGLPSDCLKGVSQTTEQRRNALVAKLVDSGESTLQSLIDAADEIGYEITIDEFYPFEAGVSAAGDPCAGEDWIYALRFNAPATDITLARAGSALAGDPLRLWGDEYLECILSERLHAHWYAIFGYEEV